MSRETRLQRFRHLPRLDPRIEILPTSQADVWNHLGDIPQTFVLYGGTGLALRLGHRPSADFDFFSPTPFVPTDLVHELAALRPVSINEASPNHLVVTTSNDVRLSFLGGLGLQAVAECSVVEENGLVIASLFDLAGTQAKAILDRSEWKDYVDIAALLRHGLTLGQVIGYASTIFAPMFEFPTAVFLRSIAWFGDGTAGEVPADVQDELERAAVAALHEGIPYVMPYAPTIEP